MDMTKQRAAFQKYQTMGDSSCENELEELMHQIDIMVNSKKVEWEKQVLVLEQRLEAQEKRLEAQEQELITTRCIVDQKDCEIGVFSIKLEEAEKSRHEVVQNYETQLEALKMQLSKLKKSYDKLHYYYVKNHNSDIPDASPEHERCQTDLRRVSQRLEEYKEQADQWENQRRVYQENIQKLNEQRENLIEKCEYLQQSHSPPEQRSCRTRLEDEAITNNQSDIRRLRCQLEASQETIRSGRGIIENLKTTVKEITLSRNSLKAENLHLLQELRDCQKRCQRMESKLSEARIELQARQDLCRAAELDQRQLHTLISEKDEESKFSSQESHVFMEEQASNREKLQKRLKLSPCKKDQVEKDFIKEIRNIGLERLQADVSDLTERLHRKDVTIATISRKVSRLEQELDMKEHGNVHRQVLISSDGHSHLHDLTLEPEMETPLEYCSDGQDLEGLQLEMMKTFSWQSGITGKRSQGKHDGSSEEDEPTPKMADDTNNNVSSYRRGDGLLTDQGCLEFILPKLRSPTQKEHHYPDLTDFSHLDYDQSGDSTAEQSFVSAAERFLQEENRRARDFENILNLQIEDLQRQSEHTVKRCRSRGYSDCPPASS
ncbi:deuterosome assembly protein 1-like isoform X2 [Phyllobates terribilis]|uniref:deuterosome assembly protein 1-like isoform X2 n=1 Tax=Phyllobates terribilis TaxID=111132 RepID=UPI003CCAC976